MRKSAVLKKIAGVGRRAEKLSQIRLKLKTGERLNKREMKTVFGGNPHG
jgi:hypothetical protein